MRSRQKIVEATLELIEGKGFAAVNMASVAAAASVSRQTVYSIFGSREDLVSQVMGGLATELVADARARLQATTGAGEYVVELIVIGRAQIREHPVLGALLRRRDRRAEDPHRPGPRGGSRLPEHEPVAGPGRSPR